MAKLSVKSGLVIIIIVLYIILMKILFRVVRAGCFESVENCSNEDPAANAVIALPLLPLQGRARI